jgi:hypothetical protein
MAYIASPDTLTQSGPLRMIVRTRAAGIIVVTPPPAEIRRKKMG